MVRSARRDIFQLLRHVAIARTRRLPESTGNLYTNGLPQASSSEIPVYSSFMIAQNTMDPTSA